ncbi:MAG: hypothetical protein ABS36_08720 [Acidobacteria bacterium SCN 69-37]|nr:MAG: hypothetical protein ABS36_08720 [Acidobacteria bacterium SCN 69-37]
MLELRADPHALAPERVIVFEVAGLVSDFARALSSVPGFELLVEHDIEHPPDDLFAERDERVGREGQRRDDKNVGGRLYLTMPDLAALNQLLSLWERYQNGQDPPTGLAPFKHVFAQLRTLRPWGPEDRISAETLAYMRAEHEREPARPVRTEIELWFRRTPERRQQSAREFRAAVEAVGGTVLHEAELEPIAYHGMLVDIPAGAVADLIAGQRPAFALADDVMFLRPQTVLSVDAAPETSDPPPDAGDHPRPQATDPLVALFDGVPVQAHQLLDGRLILDDPDDLQARSPVARRFHGTAMASLMVHGDLHVGHAPLTRPVYVRPLMIAPPVIDEHTPADRLLVDVLYRAVLRMKGEGNVVGVAPTVFIINLSVGDRRRPFANMISPLARLLDYLATRFNILFLVSAGNIRDALEVQGFSTWNEFEQAQPAARERAVLTALNATKHERSLLSPAESINSLTIGAHHADNVPARIGGVMTVDPFDDDLLPNVSSALGLGYRRATKPELYLPGGREHLRMSAAGGGSSVQAAISGPQRLYGLSAAAPDPGSAGRLDQRLFSCGTSAATALASRAAHQIIEGLLDADGGSTLADTPPRFYAVVVKALMAHSARWNGKGDLLREICGPPDTRRHEERSANVARFLGFGVPSVARVLDCAENQATLVGYGTLRAEEGHRYRIPLPESLRNVTDPRALTVTVAWLSPVRPGNQSYRGVRFEAAALEPRLAIGVERERQQPGDRTVQRGTIFHERFTGERAAPFVDNGHLSLDVWCKDDAGNSGAPASYALAVTIETGTPLRIYEEVQQRLRVRAVPPA